MDHSLIRTIVVLVIVILLVFYVKIKKSRRYLEVEENLSTPTPLLCRRPVISNRIVKTANPYANPDDDGYRSPYNTGDALIALSNCEANITEDISNGGVFVIYPLYDNQNNSTALSYNGLGVAIEDGKDAKIGPGKYRVQTYMPRFREISTVTGCDVDDDTRGWQVLFFSLRIWEPALNVIVSGDITGPTNNLTVTWDPITDAESYIIEVTINGYLERNGDSEEVFISTRVGGFTPDTTIIIPTQSVYYWSSVESITAKVRGGKECNSSVFTDLCT
jgi:hypothetical protein